MLKKLMPLVAVCAGLCLLLFPWISNWAYDHRVESQAEAYESGIALEDPAALEAVLEEARQYNSRLAVSNATLTDPFLEAGEQGEDLEYLSMLSMDGSGPMCFVDIPKIGVCLPVYHGTSQEVLEKGAGHLEGSSLPVGGAGAHAVISAHSGINSAKMFSDLTEMEEGDLFLIHVLGETLAYRVCGIQVILPEDTGCLLSQEGRDLVSLLTCTPYGVNSHRLVVTGERTEYTEAAATEAAVKTSDEPSQWMEAYRKALLAGLFAVAAAAAAIKLYKFGKTRHRR